MKKMIRKQEKDQTTQVILALVSEAEALKKQAEEIKSTALNPFQPPPELTEIETMVN